MSKEAMTLARQIIWRYRHETPLGNQPHMIAHDADEAIERIDQALAKQEQGEPVAWSVTRYGIHCNNVFSNKTLAEIELKRLDEKYGKEGRTLVPLYTTPQPTQKPYEILAMQVRPSEFAELIKGKEAVTGIPAYWAEWPNKEKP
jgi:hypothetical protein